MLNDAINLRMFRHIEPFKYKINSNQFKFLMSYLVFFVTILRFSVIPKKKYFFSKCLTMKHYTDKMEKYYKMWSKLMDKFVTKYFCEILTIRY